MFRPVISSYTLHCALRCHILMIHLQLPVFTKGHHHIQTSNINPRPLLLQIVSQAPLPLPFSYSLSLSLSLLLSPFPAFSFSSFSLFLSFFPRHTPPSPCFICEPRAPFYLFPAAKVELSIREAAQKLPDVSVDGLFVIGHFGALVR